MHPNEQIVQRFFHCFAEGDYRGMQQCLHPDIEFSDIGFNLHGKEVGAMWQMICAKGTQIMFRNVQAGNSEGTAHWECHYDFQKEEGAKAHSVHNVIESRFRFADGRIREHHDLRLTMGGRPGPGGARAGEGAISAQAGQVTRAKLDKFPLPSTWFGGTAAMTRLTAGSRRPGRHPADLRYSVTGGAPRPAPCPDRPSPGASFTWRCFPTTMVATPLPSGSSRPSLLP